jgi:hypothetical protein
MVVSGVTRRKRAGVTRHRRAELRTWRTARVSDTDSMTNETASTTYDTRYSPLCSPERIVCTPWVMEKPAPATNVKRAAMNAQT